MLWQSLSEINKSVMVVCQSGARIGNAIDGFRECGPDPCVDDVSKVVVELEVELRKSVGAMGDAIDSAMFLKGYIQGLLHQKETR